MQQEATISYHMICNVVFVDFWGTLLRPQTDCGSCSADPKIHHPAKRPLAMCQHTGEFLRDFVLVFHRDICREHSLIKRRNYLMTEAPNSLSAAAGPKLPVTRKPIANPGSD